MLRAERRARTTGKLASENSDQTQTKIDESLEPEDGVPRLWWNAILPIVVTIFIGALEWFSTYKNRVDAISGLVRAYHSTRVTTADFVMKH